MTLLYLAQMKLCISTDVFTCLKKQSVFGCKASISDAGNPSCTEGNQNAEAQTTANDGLSVCETVAGKS